MTKPGISTCEKACHPFVHETVKDECFCYDVQGFLAPSPKGK